MISGVMEKLMALSYFTGKGALLGDPYGLLHLGVLFNSLRLMEGRFIGY